MPAVFLREEPLARGIAQVGVTMQISYPKCPRYSTSAVSPNRITIHAIAVAVVAAVGVIVCIPATVYSQEFSDIGANLAGVAASSVAWGDYDDDGDLDILLTGLRSGGYYAKIYQNSGDGTFSDSGIPLTGVSRSTSAWGDCDNDGDLDILLTGAIDDSDTKISRVIAVQDNLSIRLWAL